MVLSIDCEMCVCVEEMSGLYGFHTHAHTHNTGDKQRTQKTRNIAIGQIFKVFVHVHLGIHVQLGNHDKIHHL